MVFYEKGSILDLPPTRFQRFPTHTKDVDVADSVSMIELGIQPDMLNMAIVAVPD